MAEDGLAIDSKLEMAQEDDFVSAISSLDESLYNENSWSKREQCNRCTRPLTCCLCSFLPEQPLRTRSTVVILKHPSEEKRTLTTVPLLRASLADDCCKIFVGKSFCDNKPPELKQILFSKKCFLVYPGRDAKSLQDSMDNSCDPSSLAFFFLDASWNKVGGLLDSNRSWLQEMPRVQLDSQCLSLFVIRTQPDDTCLCTLEAVALTLSFIERDSSLLQTLLTPLRHMCDIQLGFGAKVHASRQQKRANLAALLSATQQSAEHPEK